MAAFTSKATGDWSASGQTTWNEVGVPGNGDTVTIATGHVITVSSNTTVGTSPTSAPTTVLINQGQLIINAGVTLTVKGSLRLSGTTGSNGLLSNSGNLVFDSSAGGTIYSFVIGFEVNSTAKFVMPGTISSRPSVSTTGSFKTRMQDGANASCGRIEADYADFTDMGDSSNPMSAFTLSASTDNYYLRNCRMVRCGRVYSTVTPVNTSKLIITNNAWSGTVSSQCVTIAGNAPSGAGVRTIADNRFDATAEFYPSTGLSLSGNQFHGGHVINGYTAASCSYNMFNGDTVIPYNCSTYDYFYGSAVLANAHPVQLGNDARNFVIVGPTFDLMSSTEGDLIVGSPASGAYVASVTYALVLPNAAGADPGKLISPLGSRYTWTVEHNTVTSTRLPSGGVETGVTSFGESGGATGVYASVKSNYAWAKTGKASFVVRTNTSTIQDGVAAANANYNASNDPINAVSGSVFAVFGPIGGYADTLSSPSVTMFSTTTGLGANDVVAIPSFVDSTRCLATFDTAYLGNTASAAWADATSYAVDDIISSTDSGFYGSAVINFRCRTAHTSAAGHATNGKPGASATTSWRTNWELASTWRIRTNAVSYNASVRQPTPRDLIEWVRAGFCTQNPALATAGHDGGVIGIGYTAAASGYTYMSNGGEGPVFNYLEC